MNQTKKYACLAVINALLLVMPSNLYSQQLSWELTSDGAGISDNQNISCTDFKAGNGLSSFTFSSTGAYAKSWNPAELDENDYFEVGFFSTASDTFELNTLEFSERRSNTAIREYEIRYSDTLDFSTYTSLGVFAVPDNDSEREMQINNLDLLIYPQDTFYLRWYGYLAESSAGSWRINDGSLKMFLSSYVIDLTAPVLESAEVINLNTIQMNFDESLDSTSFRLSDFQIDQTISPSLIDKSMSNQGMVILTFADDLPVEQSINLKFQNIADPDGNVISAESAIDLFYYQAQAFYVLIDEILSDPTPVIYLPENEYIELYNTKDFPINLENWKLQVNSSEYTIPTCEIEANSYLLLVPEDGSSSYDTNLNIVEMNFGSLTNSSSRLILKSEENTWIHQVNYNEDWHTESYKKDGGWSLEMIDKSQPCNMLNNWSSSIDTQGGTPGKKNSIDGINTDSQDLEILNVYFDTTNVIIQFNQYLPPTYEPNASNFLLEQTNPDIAVYMQGEDYLSLSFPDAFEPNVVYQLTINDALETCDDLQLDIPMVINIGIPTLVDSNDIVINEILFNPIGDNKQYIEFYNQSEKILDLQEMKLAVLEDDLVSPKDVISEVPMIIFPNDYFVLTKDRNNVLGQLYVKHPDRLFETDEIPSLSTTEEYVYLLNKGDVVIDKSHYNEDFHNPILANNEGVALERINPESSGLISGSWQSASQSSGFGTPTYINSQFSEAGSTSSDVIAFETETFSPDMDGYHDYLVINYQLEKSGYTANVNVYNSKGQAILELVSNEFTAKEGQWTWDGRNTNGESSPLGIYIVVFEFIHSDGELIQEKKVCTLAGKL